MVFYSPVFLLHCPGIGGRGTGAHGLPHGTGLGGGGPGKHLPSSTVGSFLAENSFASAA